MGLFLSLVLLFFCCFLDLSLFSLSEVVFFLLWCPCLSQETSAPPA